MRSERCERIAVRRPEGMSAGMRTGQKPGRKVRERDRTQERYGHWPVLWKARRHLRAIDRIDHQG